MTEHTYPSTAMLGDYLRAAAGFVPAIAILSTAPVGVVGVSILGGIAALFAVFGIRTALSHGTRIEIADGEVRSSGLLRVSISLRELDRMKLAYYATRRDGRGGWMQLELRSGASTLRLDSRIEGFAALVEASARAAERRGLSLSPATLANVQAVGVELRPAEVGLNRAIGGAS